MSEKKPWKGDNHPPFLTRDEIDQALTIGLPVLVMVLTAAGIVVMEHKHLDEILKEIGTTIDALRNSHTEGSTH